MLWSGWVGRNAGSKQDTGKDDANAVVKHGVVCADCCDSTLLTHLGCGCCYRRCSTSCRWSLLPR
jgi:hypothetical protein